MGGGTSMIGLLDNINNGLNFDGDVKSKYLYSPIITKGKEQEIAKEDEIKKCNVVDEPETQILINEKEQAVETPIIESTTQPNESENYGEKEETSKIIEPEMIEVDKEEEAEKNVIVQEVPAEDVIAVENKITEATSSIQEHLVESGQSVVEEILVKDMTLEENKTTEETSSIQENVDESAQSVVEEVLTKDITLEENKTTEATSSIQENLVESAQSVVEEVLAKDITLEENKTTEETSSIQENLVGSAQSVVEEVLANDITLEENKITEETSSLQENLAESVQSVVEEVLANDITLEENKTTGENSSIQANLAESAQSVVDEVLVKDISLDENKTTEENSSIQENLVEPEESVVEEVIAKYSALDENKTTDDTTNTQESLVEPELNELEAVIPEDITIEENKTAEDTSDMKENLVEALSVTVDVATNIVTEKEEKDVVEETDTEKYDVKVLENITPSGILAETEKELETAEDIKDKDDDDKEESNVEIVLMEVNQADIEKNTENTETEINIKGEVTVEEIGKDEISQNESSKATEIIDDNKIAEEDEKSIEKEEVTFTKDDNAEAVECSQIQTQELETISEGNTSANNNAEIMENVKCNEVFSESFEDEIVEKEADNNLNDSGNLIVESKITPEIEKSITVEHLEQSTEEGLICTNSENHLKESEQEEEIKKDIGSTEVKVETIVEDKQIVNEVDAIKNEEVPQVENVLDISDGVWECQWNLSCIDSKKEEADFPMTMQTPDVEEIAVEETTEELQPQFDLSKEEERDDRNGQISELSSFDSINTVIQRTDNQMASSQDIETQDENNAVTEETNNDNKLEAGECGNTCSIDFDFYFLKLRESCAWFILNVSTGNIRLVTKHRIWGIHNYSSTHLNLYEGLA